VARDAVVIKPREDKDAITFSGQQVGPVKYQIANLTIRANDPDLNQENAVVFNFDLGIDPPPNPPLASEIVFDNVWVSLDGGGCDGFKALTRVDDVTLRGVTIPAAEYTSHPIQGNIISRLKIHDCDYLAVDGGVTLGEKAEVRDSRIVIDRSFGSAPQSLDDFPAVAILQSEETTIRNTYMESGYAAILLAGTSKLTVQDCIMQGGNFEVFMATNSRFGQTPGVSDVTIDNCSISAESSRGGFDVGLGNPLLPYRAVAIQSPIGLVTLRGCDMLAMANRFPQATNGNPIAASSEGVVVETNTSGAAPLGGAVVLERCSIRAVSEPDGETDATGIWSKSISGIIATDCTISARQTWIGDTATPSKAHGVLGATPEAVSLVGGQITSFDVSERENDQFDIRNDSTSEVRVRVRGTAMSKWKGAIGSSERPRVNVQRMVSVAAPIATAILYAKVLTTMEVEITKTDLSLMQLDNCRVLTATLSGGTGLQSSLPVTIIGTNWGGEQIAETKNVLGTTEFQKPFRSVRKIILPARALPGQQISIGTSARLGLHSPVTDLTDFLVVSKSVGGAAFLPEAFSTADLDLVNHTYKVPSITAGAAYEFSYRASE